MTSRSPVLMARGLEARDVARGGEVLVGAFNKVFGEHGFLPPFPSPESGQHLVESYLAYPHARGVVVEAESGRLVAIAFVHPRGATAGVGPVAVEPAHQARRTGRLLMEALLEATPGVRSFRLTQDAFNNVSFALYHKLGFVVRDVMLALERSTADLEPVDIAGIRPMRPEDVGPAAALDAQLTGINRPQDFDFIRQIGDGFVLERRGAPAGYLLRRLTGRYMTLGPAAAHTDEDLFALIAGAMAANPFHGVGLRALASRPAILNRLLAAGFRIGHLGTYMVRGAWTPPVGAHIPASFPESI
jgi:GNAT superfamily N-acetyltransferase